MEKCNNLNEVAPENVGIYDLNCKLAKALNLKHKPELDCQNDFSSHSGNWKKWDQRSINIKLHPYSRIQEIDFTRRIDILMAYCMGYGIDLITSGSQKKAIVSFQGKFDSKEICGDTISRVLIDAILLHCETMNINQPQTLHSNFNEML